MERDVAATAGFHKVDPAAGKFRFIEQQIADGACAQANGVDRLVLREYEGIRCAPGDPCRKECLLRGEGIAVAGSPPVEYGDGGGAR
jgi:hypothetical protein